MPKPPEKPAGIILSCNTIFEGKFIAAGTVTPYKCEADLPESLKPFVADEGETFYAPADRDLYAHPDPRIQPDPLPPETQAELEAAHIRRMSLLMARAEGVQNEVDAVYERAEAKAKVTRYFVRRGGNWGAVQNANLKPGEPVFVKRPNGEMEVSGYIDSKGDWPDPEIVP